MSVTGGIEVDIGVIVSKLKIHIPMTQRVKEAFPTTPMELRKPSSLKFKSHTVGVTKAEAISASMM